jgi:hypothetical protein
MNAADMILATFAPYLAIVVLAGMLVLLEAGRRLGRLPGGSQGAGTSAVDAAVFALLGLLIAFTFSGAAQRFDGRRALLTEEANDIGTAYLRLDLLPESERPALRDLFRRYLDLRIETYRKLPDVDAAMALWDESVGLQKDIWSEGIAACAESGSSPATMLLLPALNAMIDVSTTRFMATQVHPPIFVYVMLVVVALLAALLAGYGMASSEKRPTLHMLVFAAVMAVTVFVIVDLEYPRSGLIRVDAADEVLVELRRSMD